MIKKGKRTTTVNVGFMENVIVPVDISTNLASIDVTELIRLYQEHGIAKDKAEMYEYRYNSLKENNKQLIMKNNDLAVENKKLEEENEKLKVENERLITKNTGLRIRLNSVYGLPKTLCCGRHHGESCYPCTGCFKGAGMRAQIYTVDDLIEPVKCGKGVEEAAKKLAEEANELAYNLNAEKQFKEFIDSQYGAPRRYSDYNISAFAKAAESLAKHLEAGKPTYDQLLEENKVLLEEARRLRASSELLIEDLDYHKNVKRPEMQKEIDSLRAEVDELDKECDALVEEKEKLQAEVDSLRSSLAGFEKKNGELINELATCKKKLEDTTNVANHYIKYYLEH